MIKVFSKVTKKKLLHIIFKLSKKKTRTNISPDKEFLQASYLPLTKNQEIKPHKHFWKTNSKKKIIVQEAWVVIRGKIKVYLYDINNTLLIKKTLFAGDFSITFEGPHSIESLNKNTIIYEFKTGPYEGQSKDLIYLK